MVPSHLDSIVDLVRRSAPFLLLAALAAAGCGARSSAPFTAKATVACLKKKDFRNVSSSPLKVGFIAGFAANGGLVATSPGGNAVTIAFTESADSVSSTEEAFRRHAPPTLRPHITDVMRVQRNAVIVWTTSPSDGDESTVEGCLAS
jgi:hypothetical protein